MPAMRILLAGQQGACLIAHPCCAAPTCTKLCGVSMAQERHLLSGRCLTAICCAMLACLLMQSGARCSALCAAQKHMAYCKATSHACGAVRRHAASHTQASHLLGPMPWLRHATMYIANSTKARRAAHNIWPDVHCDGLLKAARCVRGFFNLLFSSSESEALLDCNCALTCCLDIGLPAMWTSCFA